MSEEQLPYSPLYIKAWTLLSIIVGSIFLAMFIFGDRLLHAANWVWDLIRYLGFITGVI